MNLRRATVAALTLLAAASGLLAAPTRADADTTVNLAITGFADLVVDQAHGHVFISQGNGTLLITNLDGVKTGTKTGLYGAAGMTLSDDGSTLFVGLSDGDAVAAIDTTTLSVTTFPTGTSTCPASVAYTAATVWFATSCGSGGIGALDPATGTVTLNRANLSGALLAASPALPGKLLAIEAGISPVTVYGYDAVVGDTTTLTEYAHRWDVGGNGQDLAITPDGTKVLVASGAPYEHPAFLTTDFSSAGTYASSNYPNSVAIRPDGMVAAGILGIYSPDVFVYPAGSHSLMRKYEFGGTSNELLPRGLAFGTTRLYAVTADTYNDNNYRLWVITPRRAARLSVTTDRSTYAFGAGAKVKIGLAAGPANASVKLYATPLGGTRKLVATRPVSLGGSVTVTARVEKKTKFEAIFAGTADYSNTSASKSVPVSARVTPKMLGSIGRSGKAYVYRISKPAVIQGTVSPNHAGDCLYLRAQFFVNGHWGYDATTGCVKMSSTSYSRGHLPGDKVYLGVPIRMRAEWRGDTQNLAKNSTWLFVKFVR